jgi:ribokinase
MTKPIVVVGSINMDLVGRTHTIPRPGETVTGTGFETTPGGKGANQAVAVARLGYPVKMIGQVGNDVFGHTLIENLSEAGVGVWAIEHIDGPSGVAQILVGERGDNCIVVVPGANGKVDAAYIDKNVELIRGAGMVLLQLEIPMDTVMHVLDVCAKAKVPTMLDPAPAAALPENAWKQLTWVTPNDREVGFYLDGGSDAVTAAQKLLSKGVSGVVLKRGEEGAYVANAKGRAAWVKPFPVLAIDTVGAGDCFNGAFAVALMEGKDPSTAARFASAAAAISVTRRGAQASMPTRAEVDNFLVQHKSGA